MEWMEDDMQSLGLGLEAAEVDRIARAPVRETGRKTYTMTLQFDDMLQKIEGDKAMLSLKQMLIDGLTRRITKDGLSFNPYEVKFFVIRDPIYGVNRLHGTVRVGEDKKVLFGIDMARGEGGDGYVTMTPAASAIAALEAKEKAAKEAEERARLLAAIAEPIVVRRRVI